MNILFPVRPQDPRIENILVNSPMLKENRYFVKSLPTDIKSFENLYVFLADGSLKKIKNYSSYLENRKTIFEYSLDKYRESFSSPEEMEKEFNIVYERLDKGKVNTEEDLLAVARDEMRMTSLYYIIENRIDNTTDEDRKAIQDSINKIRDENITNELELVNKTIRDSLPNNDIPIEIKKCMYNGKEIDTGECIAEIESHVFPDYITQKNIMDTLEDQYVIETNVCTIVRDKGGDIRILESKNNGEEKE